MSYDFYGSDNCSVSPVNSDFKGIESPKDLYDALLGIWCRYSCAPRLRDKWSPDNPTLGQCSITAFLVQEIFGGKVLGVLRPGGNYHCFNQVGTAIFDLTSEQFGNEVLDYSNAPEQLREVHFAGSEKLRRYTYLRDRLLDR